MIIEVAGHTIAGETWAECLATFRQLAAGSAGDEYRPAVPAWSLAEIKARSLELLNYWRGARRAALGLTAAEFQEIVYTGKVLESQRWLTAPESPFGLASEATARGISNEAMAALVLGQWSAWQSASDAIEAAYITARLWIEAAEDEAEIARVLAGLK